MITEKPFESSAEGVLRQIEGKARKSFLPIIRPLKGKYLAEEIRKVKPRHVLEVGTLIGYSAILMGNELEKDAEIITIEIHREEAEQANENLIKANLQAKIEIFVGDAIQAIPTLRGPFDFAFIDAEKSEYLQYLRLAEEKFHTGTVVFADNAGIFAAQMSDYLDYVRNSGKYESRYVQVGDDGVEISVKL